MMFVMLLFAWSNSWAEGLPAAASGGPVILTVSGNLAGSVPVTFTLKELQALKSRTFRVQHDWSDTPHTYKGPLLSAVLEHAGARGDSLRLTALNEYFVDIDRAFVKRWQPILAWQEDGRTMRVRNKGPLWLMTPLDSDPVLREPDNVSRLIWQLSDIEVR